MVVVVVVVMMFLSFGAMQTCKSMPAFQKKVLSPASPLKMEAVCFMKMLASTYKSAQLQTQKIIIMNLIQFTPAQPF
jgi:hypothetical protein